MIPLNNMKDEWLFDMKSLEIVFDPNEWGHSLIQFTNGARAPNDCDNSLVEY